MIVLATMLRRGTGPARGAMAMSSRAEAAIGSIRDLYRAGGDHRYAEAVTQLQHALQSATLAEQDGASAELVTAALLHDVGHLLIGAYSAEQDLSHEAVGNTFLAQHFGPAVCNPVALHVDAKRYLCAVDPEYEPALSAASRNSLRLQGGPLIPVEVDAFLKVPFAKDAARLRRWDDLAKRADATTPSLEHFIQRHVIRALEAAEGRQRAGGDSRQ